MTGKSFLPFLTPFKKHYYSGLVLQTGHRKSEDFDFFASQPFSTTELSDEIRKYLVKYTLVKIQEEENTLTILVNDIIKISFFTIRIH